MVKNREVALSKAEMEFANTELRLEVYLWDKGFVPLELDGVVPAIAENITNISFYDQLDSLISNHPYLKLNKIKIHQNKIDLKLKKDQLKPKLTLKYNAISEPVGNNPVAEYSFSNYVWGGSISYPILSRKERAEVNLSKLKLENQELMNSVATVEIDYKIKAALNKYAQSLEQFAILEELVDNNRLLYSAEIKLFRVGESSVFMLNSRENKLLGTQIKFIESKNSVRILKSQLDFMLMSF